MDNDDNDDDDWDDDDWDWDEDENKKVETDTTTKKGDCTVNASNPHHFGFYKGRSRAALERCSSDVCHFRYQWYGEEHEDSEDREE